MIRSSFLLLLLPLSAQGFGVTTTPFAVQRATLLSAAPDDDTVIPEADNEAEPPAFFMSADTEIGGLDTESMSNKLQSVFKDVQTKAQDMISEDRIKEITSKRQEADTTSLDKRENSGG